MALKNVTITMTGLTAAQLIKVAKCLPSFGENTPLVSLKLDLEKRGIDLLVTPPLILTRDELWAKLNMYGRFFVPIGAAFEEREACLGDAILIKREHKSQYGQNSLVCTRIAYNIKNEPEYKVLDDYLLEQGLDLNVDFRDWQSPNKRGV